MCTQHSGDSETSSLSLLLPLAAVDAVAFCVCYYTNGNNNDGVTVNVFSVYGSERSEYFLVHWNGGVAEESQDREMEQHKSEQKRYYAQYT